MNESDDKSHLGPNAAVASGTGRRASQSGSSPSLPTSCVVRVRFAETDQMGVAHHSVYPVWCEASRVEWMRVRGLSYREMEASGLSLAVSRLDIAYRSAAYFDDEIDVKSQLRSVRSRRLLFSYRLERLSDGRLIATGETEHVPTDRSGRAVRLPERWLEPLRRP